MSKALPRLPLILLGVMTLLTFGGPIAIGAILRGGGSSAWPPDRPIEWAVLGTVSGLVAVLMLACCGLALATRKPAAKPNPPHPPGDDRPEVRP